MELQGDLGHVESRSSPFGDNVSIGARYVHGFHQTYHRLKNHFGRTRNVLLGDEAQVEAHFGPFGDNTNLDAR
jgi:hypothetical protein